MAKSNAFWLYWRVNNGYPLNLASLYTGYTECYKSSVKKQNGKRATGRQLKATPDILKRLLTTTWAITTNKSRRNCSVIKVLAFFYVLFGQRRLWSRLISLSLLLEFFFLIILWVCCVSVVRVFCVCWRKCLTSWHLYASSFSVKFVAHSHLTRNRETGNRKHSCHVDF